jgi:hypothetical protein
VTPYAQLISFLPGVNRVVGLLAFAFAFSFAFSFAVAFSPSACPSPSKML